MKVAEEQEHSYASLVREDRVHSSIFTDESIFEAELERIFYNHWVFLAHASEVQQAGDYCVKTIGRKQIIVSRDKDGAIRAFFNRCRHRGSAVCSYPKGNASFFRCPYHGWTYSNAGELVGVPYQSRYGADFDRSELGLARVPHLGEYRGFIFVSLAEEAPDLMEYLGRAAPFLDLFLNASPTDRIELSAGASKSVFRGNWKFVGMDGYHVNFTHKTVLDLQTRAKGPSRARGVNNSDKSPNESWDLGNGHCRLDQSHGDPVDFGEEEAPGQDGTDVPGSEADQVYMAALEQRWGSRAAVTERLNRAHDVHLHVWPNLQLIGGEVRVIRPISAGVTEVTGYLAMLGDVPEEINARRIRAYEWFNGVAGFGSPDDREIFERNQIGLQADQEPWILLARGQEMAEASPRAELIGNITDEVTQRCQMRQWRKVMR